MIGCHICNNTIERKNEKEEIDCKKCRKTFHSECAGIKTNRIYDLIASKWLCYDCYNNKYVVKLNECHICIKPIHIENERDEINCNACSKTFHSGCVGISSKRSYDLLASKWFCHICYEIKLKKRRKLYDRKVLLNPNLSIANIIQEFAIFRAVCENYLLKSSNILIHSSSSKSNYVSPNFKVAVKNVKTNHLSPNFEVVVNNANLTSNHLHYMPSSKNESRLKAFNPFEVQKYLFIRRLIWDPGGVPVIVFLYWFFSKFKIKNLNSNP